MLEKLINYYQKKIKILSLFKDGKKYLAQGKYTVDITFNYFHLNSHSNLAFCMKNFRDNYSINLEKNNFLFIKRILNFIIKTTHIGYFKVIRNSKKEGKFKGQIFLPFPNLDGYRIFDIQSNEVLYIYFSKKEYYSKVKSYEYFKSYFNIPKILLSSRSEQLIIEKLIKKNLSSKLLPIHYDVIFDKILKDYMDYFNAIKKTHYEKIKVDKIDVSDKHKISIESIIKKINSSVLSTPFPVIKLHGDLWLPNILIDENKTIYYIDWDRSNDLIFIFDIFSFIWKEEYYLKEYLSGSYNHFMDKIFNIFEIDFNEEYLIDYLYVYIVFYYNERWKALNAIELNEKVSETHLKIEKYKSIDF